MNKIEQTKIKKEEDKFSYNKGQALLNEKNEQRKILKSRVEQFDNKEQASLQITNKLLQLEEYQKAKSIFIYLSVDYEVNTENIIKDAFKEGKKVYAPIINKKNEMYPSRLCPFSVYKKGKFGIREPLIKAIAKKEIELAIIPLAGFDKQKNRLGRGGGYYDRFLKDYKGKIMALAFSCQKLENIASQSHDIKPHKIITEDEIF